MFSCSLLFPTTGPLGEPAGCSCDFGTRAGTQFWHESRHPGARLRLQDDRGPRGLHHDSLNRVRYLFLFFFCFVFTPWRLKIRSWYKFEKSVHISDLNNRAEHWVFRLLLPAAGAHSQPLNVYFTHLWKLLFQAGQSENDKAPIAMQSSSSDVPLFMCNCMREAETLTRAPTHTHTHADFGWRLKQLLWHYTQVVWVAEITAPLQVMDFLTVSKQQADKVKLEPSNRFQCQAGSRLVCLMVGPGGCR